MVEWMVGGRGRLCWFQNWRLMSRNTPGMGPIITTRNDLLREEGKRKKKKGGEGPRLSSPTLECVPQAHTHTRTQLGVDRAEPRSWCP